MDGDGPDPRIRRCPSPGARRQFDSPRRSLLEGCIRALVGDERGSILALVAVSLVALLGMAALAIDLGIMYTARSEAQRSADSGAHAGAGVFLLAPGNWGGAREQARQFAEGNTVRWGSVEPTDQDIEVIPDSQKVRVQVMRTRDRGNPIPTLFARVLGIETVDVGAVAAAQSWPSDRTDCMLPFALPDRWDVYEEGVGYRPSRSRDVFDPDRGDRYYSPASPREDGYYRGTVGTASENRSSSSPRILPGLLSPTGIIPSA